MQTTATYDAATQSFDLHSPTTLSFKYWITNGAVHAHWAVVFAHLHVGQASAFCAEEGEKREGGAEEEEQEGALSVWVEVVRLFL